MAEAAIPSLANDAVVRVSDLTRCFADLIAIDSINLDISRGEIFGLVEPTGAGKKP